MGIGLAYCDPFCSCHTAIKSIFLLLKATEMGTLERVRKVGAQADLLLCPPVRQFGMTEVKSFDRIVQAGYEHARKELEAWLERRQRGSE